MNEIKKIENFIKALKISDFAILKPDDFSDQKQHFLQWLNNGYNASMQYMERNTDKRLDPKLLVENVKSIIIVLKNYYPHKKQNPETLQISKYAYGTDYHNVLKKDLYRLLKFINDEIAPATGRAFVDSAPVLERQMAKRAGLGWIGKNSLLLTKKGSYFFIGELFIDLELPSTNRLYSDYCGTCTACIDACPTKAIVKPYVVDANKCISYLTIEKKGNFDKNMSLNFKNFIFGCDICQDVCPWNKKASPTDEALFEPHFLLFSLKKQDWINLSKETFNKIFKKTPVKRTKYEGLKRNIEYVTK